MARHLRKAAFILSLIFGTLAFAQNPESSNLYEKEYYDLINYVPRNLKVDSIHKPESELLRTDLNTIKKVQFYSSYRKDFKLTESDIHWLDNKIQELATAFYLDDKRILISSVGGYSGCPNQMIDTLRLNNIGIVNLKFCQSCTDNFNHERFIRIFNDKMYSLMKIEPPNIKTKLLYGEYKGVTKERFEIKLILKKDRTFKFWINKGHSSDFTEGLWRNTNDTLILKSKNLTIDDDISFALSSANWIEFNDIKFHSRKDKLIELNSRKRKLKKVFE